MIPALFQAPGFSPSRFVLFENDDNDCYQVCFDSEVDFAWNLFEDCHSNAIPDNLICYFDCEAFAPDLFIRDYCSVNVNGMSHILKVLK